MPPALACARTLYNTLKLNLAHSPAIIALPDGTIPPEAVITEVDHPDVTTDREHLMCMSAFLAGEVSPGCARIRMRQRMNGRCSVKEAQKSEWLEDDAA